MRSYHVDRAGSLEGLSLRQREVPVPGTGEVLVRMHAAAIGQRDLMVFYDRYVHGIPEGMVPLSDGAGEVIATGGGVTRFRVGDRVIPQVLQRWIAGPRRAEYSGSGLGGSLDGTLRTHAVFAEQGLVSMPGHLSFAEGASVGLSGVAAWAALTAGPPLRPGEWVLVQGSGSVALWVLQLAGLFGAECVVTTRRRQNEAKLRALGASAVIEASAGDRWAEAVRSVTGGAGVSRVIDLVGGSSMEQSLEALALNGYLCTLGNLGGSGSIDPLALVGKGKIIEGIAGGSRHQLEALLIAVDRSGLRPVIDRVFPFEQAKDAIQHFDRGDRFGRVVIDMASE